jgi:hypothetical protein
VHRLAGRRSRGAADYQPTTSSASRAGGITQADFLFA